MRGPIGESLWHEVPDGGAYPSNEKWHAHLLEQYKLYVEMADRISQRRAAANSYFLSINSAILAFAGYLTASKDSTAYLWLLALAGIVLCVLWYEIIRAHRDINTAKWNVVQEIEKRLPISPYAAEWNAVDRGSNPRLYRPLSHVERGVPWVFLVLHLVVLLKTFPSSELCQWAQVHICK